MTLIQKISAVMLVGSFGFSVQAVPYQNDEFREEIKDMASKNHRTLNYRKESRRAIMQKVHLKSDSKSYFVLDVYCNIKYRNKVGPNSMPSHQFLNVEHTWPKSRFGVSKGSKAYKTRLGDLHHLYPTDSNSNSTRGNHKFSQFQKGEGDFVRTDCQSSKIGYDVNMGATAFEPPEWHKGNVARALFYMAVRHDMRISEYEEFFLRQWNIIDPVDDEERQRNDIVEEIQGNRNPFIDDPELADLIENF